VVSATDAHGRNLGFLDPAVKLHFYINNNILGLYRLMKHKRRLRKLWQETRDTACKKAVNWGHKINQTNDP
jgi:hypothetical protein